MAHYVNNNELFEEVVKYRNGRMLDKNFPVSDKIGEAILLIANGLSKKPNFAGYTYKSEMISDGIVNILQYLHNFDPAKSSNVFAYFTTICYYAFIRRIATEKKQSFIKSKMFESEMLKMSTSGTSSESLQNAMKANNEFMASDTNIEKFTKKAKKAAKKPKGLELFE